MYRRFVSILLLPYVLLIQSTAVFSHTHGGGQPAGHDLRPHVHTNPVAVDRHDSHGHSHGPNGHHHHHDDATDTREPDTQLTQQPEQPKDHDSDAVDVDASDAVLVERSETIKRVVSHKWLKIYDLGPFAAYRRATLPVRHVVWGHPPPGPFCPLFIRHLALLI
jgi:hypothetical protein